MNMEMLNAGGHCKDDSTQRELAYLRGMERLNGALPSEFDNSFHFTCDVEG